MSDWVPPPSGAQTDAFTETDLSVEPFRLALKSSPPDPVKHMSQMPSAEQQRGPDTDSDSGESLFITQKCVPKRRRRSSKRSDFRTHSDASEHEYDTSSSEEEQRPGRKRRTEGYRTPRFTFPFLQKTLMTRLPYYQNRKLHFYAMGGYFRCAKELWESYQTGGGLGESLRTVDMDGEPLSPMSEEEHGSAEGEELKVVEKKLFVESRTKSYQPWYNPKKTSGEETRHTGSRSQRGQSQTTRQILTGASLSNKTSYLKTKGFDESPAETELSNRRAPKAGNLPAETETGKTNRSPRKGSKVCDFFPKETGEPLVNENAAALLGLSAEQCGRESTEPHTGVGEENYVGDDDDNERSRIKVKKGKKKKKKDKKRDECLDEEPAECQPADPSLSVNVAEAKEALCMEKKKKKKKKKRESEERSQKVDGQPEGRKEDNSVLMWETEIGGQERRETKEGHTDSAAEPTADDGHVPKKRKKDPDGSSVQQLMPTEHQEAIDHLEDGKASQEALDPSGFKRNKLKKKKKKKKRQSQPDDNQADVDLSNDTATVAEDTDSVKKKKPKKVSELVRLPEHEDIVDDTQKEKQDVELESRKKKKRKKIRDDISMNNAVDSLASNDNTELVRKKKKKKKKKKKTTSFLSADTEGKVGQSPEEQGTPVRTASAHTGKSEVGAGDLVADSADVSEHRQKSKGVKKKKKRSAAPPESEEREAQETSEAGVKKKKKRKRTESLTGGLESVADEERSPPAEAAAERKKKKGKKGSQEVPADAAEHAGSERFAPNARGSLSSSQGKRRRSAETPCDSTETRLTGGAPGTVEERKTKKPADRNVPEGKSCTHTLDSETQKTRRKATKPRADPISTSSPTFPSARGATYSRRIEGKTGGRVKRRLHNPEQDFLSEPRC